jgi:cell division inhibitor SepF
MGLFDKLKDLVGPIGDEENDEYDDDLYEDEDEDDRAPEPRKTRDRDVRRDSSSDHDRPGGRVVNINTTTQLQVVCVKPTRYEAARDIAEHLRFKRTVVLNLETTSKDISQRLLDFLAGVVFAIDGNVKKVALSTYIITPYTVDIKGDLIDELENNGLFF